MGCPPIFENPGTNGLPFACCLNRGNPPPPESFGSVAGFASYVDSKEFRSAIAIDEPKLYCNADGTPRLFTFWRGHRVGFTPVPGALGRKLFDPLPGVCDESYTVTFTRDQATLNYWMGFKLGKLADWAGFTMIGHRAPSAMIHVQLTIRNTGEAFVTFHSSFVPSQHFYVGWQLVDRFNMLEDSDEQFRGFIEAGKCKNAPMARRVQVELSCARNRRWLR
jgi:hypothetical protein